jgi:hypothetical protein
VGFVVAVVAVAISRRGIDDELLLLLLLGIFCDFVP